MGSSPPPILKAPDKKEERSSEDERTTDKPPWQHSHDRDDMLKVGSVTRQNHGGLAIACQLCQASVPSLARFVHNCKVNDLT